MTARTIRRAERAAHLIWALMLGLYVYGLLPSWGDMVVRWVVVPGATASGLAMWFAAPLRRFSRRLSSSMTGDLPVRRAQPGRSAGQAQRDGGSPGLSLPSTKG